MARFPWSAFLTAVFFVIAAPVAPSVAQQSPASAEPVELKLKWPVGAKYVYRMEFDQESSLTLPGQPAPVKQEATMAQEFSFNVVKELENGRREVEFEWLAISMDMNMGGNISMKYDSKKPESGEEGASAIGGTLGKLVGMKVKYIMGANGRVERVEGLEELAKKMSDGNPATAQMTKGLLDESQMKRMMDAAYLPDRPVKPGDSWPLNIELPLPSLGTLKFESKGTYTGMEERKGRQCAVLKTAGTITMDQAAAPKGEQDVSMKVEKGTQEGTNWFDPNAGLLVDSTTKQSFTIQMKVKVPEAADSKAGEGNSQSMAMEVMQDISMTLVSEEKISK